MLTGKALVNELVDELNVLKLMLTERFKYPLDVANMSTIKLVINDYGDLIFMSRAAIPYPKDAIGYDLYKNVGCYALKKRR